MYPNIKNEKKKEDPTLSKITTKDDEGNGLKFETEKHDHENIENHLKLMVNFIRRSIKVWKKM